MTDQLDLFAILAAECGSCPNLGAAIESGVQYCYGDLTWRWANERVEGCRYRSRVIERPAFGGHQVVAIRDLLDHPRHSISAKDRQWLRRELRAATASPAKQTVTGPGTPSNSDLQP